MLREIYGTSSPLPTLDLENFVQRSLQLHERADVHAVAEFVSQVCFSFTTRERDANTLLDVYCEVMERWRRRYVSKHHLLEVLEQSSGTLQTCLLQRFFGFDQRREEEKIALLITNTLRSMIQAQVPMMQAIEVESVVAS